MKKQTIRRLLMQHTVNSSTFNKNNKTPKWKQNKWIPLVIIVILALLLILVNYVVIDFSQALLR